MKKIFFSAAVLVSLLSFATPPTDVNDKVLKAFNETFAHAQDVQWIETGNQYQANFMQNEIQARVWYDADGNLLQSVRYYKEQNLPLTVLAKLKSNYAGKKVFGVTELSTQTETTYQVVLEDAKTWTIVDADAYGQLTLKKKYKKA